MSIVIYNYEAYSAKKMAEVVEQFNKNDEMEIKRILDGILLNAKNGKRVITWYKNINEKVKDKLLNLGYEIEETDDLAKQKDNVYYYIYW